MRGQKRFRSWLVENLVEALLATTLPLALSYNEYGRNQEDLAKSLVLMFLVIVIYFGCLTGYLFTTALAASFWRWRKPSSYAIAVTALFQAHLQILYLIMGWHASERFVLRAAGGCIAFGCSYFGSLIQVGVERRSNKTLEALSQQ